MSIEWNVNVLTTAVLRDVVERALTVIAESDDANEHDELRAELANIVSLCDDSITEASPDNVLIRRGGCPHCGSDAWCAVGCPDCGATREP